MNVMINMSSILINFNDFNDDFSIVIGWPKYIISSCHFSDFVLYRNLYRFGQGDLNYFAIHLKYTKHLVILLLGSKAFTFLIGYT